ncbi:uncharacterized protein LOC116306745, partial [Actinia tenebrosa]|uniref:Uncharacterized protein LOC116306745 n=1 Tax=Actinia tenebrosa TaxID=6105 RepID=A0A6P8J3V2_ACTTE
LELEELERQAIEELQLLEVEKTRTSNEAYKGFNNNIQARLSSDISGCEPLTSPLQISDTPRNLKTKDLTDQWLRATPQNHMRVTIRNKTPIASPLVTHLGTHRVLDPRYRAIANPRPLVNQASGFEDPTVHKAPKATSFVNQASQSLIGVTRPMESGIQVPAGYTAPKPTHFVSQTGALPVDRTAPFTPTQQVVQTPVMNGPLDNGQPFGLLSSIKKSASKIGNKRPHFSSVASNPSFPKSLSWSDTFYSSTPGIEVVTSSFQEQSTTSNKYPNYRSVHKDGLLTNVYQPLNILTASNPTIVRDKRFYNPSELPSSTNYGNDFNEPEEKPLTSNFYQPAERSFNHHHGNAFQKPAGNDLTSLHGNNYSKPAEKPLISNNYQPTERSFAHFHGNAFQKTRGNDLTSLHGNNYSKPAEKPFASHYGNNSYMPAEKPLVSLNERSLYGGNSSNRLHLGVSGNDKVHSNGVSGPSWGGGHTQKAFASAPVATTNHVQSNGHTGSNSTYTSCLTMGKGTVVSIHSPGFMRQQPPLHSDTSFSTKPEILNTANIFNTSRIYPNINDSLSLRSAVGPSGFHRREPVMILPEVTSTLPRTGEEALPKENSTSYQNKSVDVRLPRSIETRNTLAQEALLDTEVALYTTLGVRIKKKCTRDLSNPLAKVFEEGDSQHIVPICVCSDKIYCSVHPFL